MDKQYALEKCKAIKDYLTTGNPMWDKKEVAEAMTMAIEALQIDLVRCRYCEYSQPADDYQDSYYCSHPTHNREYLVFSRCYCSYGERREDETD